MITFSEIIDKKHTGSGTVPAAFPFPNPPFLPPQGFPMTTIFLSPHAEKCLSLQKSLMQS